MLLTDPGKIFGILLIVLLISGCSKNYNYKPVDPGSVVTSKNVFIHGDTIKIITKNGKFYTVRVKQVNDNFIIGHHHKVRIDRIAILEIQHSSARGVLTAQAASGVVAYVWANGIMKIVLLSTLKLMFGIPF